MLTMGDAESICYNILEHTPTWWRFPKQNKCGVFLLSRAFDVTTTLLNIYAYGYSPDTEANPIQRHLLEQGVEYFLLFQLLVTVLAVFLISQHRWSRHIFIALIIISLLVGTSNLLIYLVTR
jgi:uncharacterized membrane protein